jgi:hypothetical protein
MSDELDAQSTNGTIEPRRGGDDDAMKNEYWVHKN